MYLIVSIAAKIFYLICTFYIFYYMPIRILPTSNKYLLSTLLSLSLYFSPKCWANFKEQPHNVRKSH